MLMYVNDVQTKEKENLPEIKKITTTYIYNTEILTVTINITVTFRIMTQYF